MYEGEWKNGFPNGQGTYFFSNGEKYVGEFKYGREHGQGTRTYNDGQKYVGEWGNGGYWNGTMYNRNGKIIDRYLNGKKE